MEQQKFRQYLNDEYLRRRDKNPNYSLRAFAKYLNVDAGSLSQFLNGHRNFSDKKLTSLAMTLGLDDIPKKNLVTVGAENYQLLSKWYYSAIIECLDLDGFEPSSNWIANKINMNASAVNAALNQLFSAGVLSLKPDGNWQNNWQNFTTQKDSEDIDHMALRNLQRQLCDLAKYSIDNESSENKSHTAYIAAIDTDLLPELKNEIRKFRRSVAKLIGKKSKKKDELYCLQINLFKESGLGENYE